MQLKLILFILSSSLIATVSSAPGGYYTGFPSGMEVRFYVNADNQICQVGAHADVYLDWGVAEDRSADEAPTKAIGLSRLIGYTEQMDLYAKAGDNLCGKKLDYLNYHNNSNIAKNCLDVSEYGEAVTCIRLWKTEPLR